MLVLALSISMLSCEKDESTAGGNSISSERLLVNDRNVPIDGVFYNECCNEEVYITGSANLLVTTNVIHLVITDQQGTGLTTGYSYTQIGNGVETNVFYSNQFEGNLVAHMNMSNSNGCSFRVLAHFHININANGDVTSDFQNITTDCES